MGGHTSFSWKKQKEDAVKLKIRRAITMVQGDNPNPDIAIKHPEWIKQANANQYTELTKKVREDTIRYQERAQKRRDRLGGKN